MSDHTYAIDATWRTLLKDLGVPAGDLLRQAALPEDLLLTPALRLPSKQYYQLWNALERKLSDRLLPMLVLDAIRAEAFSPLLFAALCSPNLKVALQRVAQYKPLIGPMHLIITEAPDCFTVEFRWLDAPLVPPASMVLMELLFTVALGRMGTRERLRPVTVMTSAPPAVLAPYEAFLEVPLQVGSSNSVTFRNNDASLPFTTENNSLWAAFEPDLSLRLASLETPTNIITRVQAALHETIPSGMLEMEVVATRLGLSKRTLQRRIEAEGTSFQQILRETRERLARHYLETTRLPAAEISFLLGFDEPNSFYRAFRRWTGTTPESVRAAS